MIRLFRRTKEHQKRHIFKIKYLFFLIIGYLAYDTTYGYLVDNKIKISSEDFLNLLISETNHHIIYKDKPLKIINQAITFLSNIDLSHPASILDINFFDKSDNAVVVSSDNNMDNYDPNQLEKVTNYIKDPNPTKVDKPLFYIYNSHQLENYNAHDLEVYNIKPNVLMASYMLKERLNNLSIPSLVEETNLTELMRINNWNHADSYKASRLVILDAKSKNSSLKYYIDIHRDSIKGNLSTITIKGKKYAKTLFVVGLENRNYRGNLALANSLDKIIKNKYPGLSRGVLKKQGAGVNGVYNQDISPNMMLIEVGGVDNNIEDVLNTIDALANVLYEYIRGDK